MKVAKIRYHNHGWTAIKALWLIVSFAIGAILASFLLGSVAKPIVTPWFLISVLLLPLTFAVNLRMKTGELTEQSGLSREEKKRLRRAIKGKKRQLNVAIIFYILSAFAIGILFVTSAGDTDLLKGALIIASGLICGSIYSVKLILDELTQLEDFKGVLADRAKQRKQQGSALKELKKKAPLKMIADNG